MLISALLTFSRSAANPLATQWEPVARLLEASANSDYIGEHVSQLEHMLQCAHLAHSRGADDELVLAALLHDVGHVCAGPDAPHMAGLGVMRHEHLGGDFLRAHGFSERVCALVAGHVDAKRYLALRKTGYLEQLSAASLGTLRHQGGPMNETEAERFEAHPLFQDFVKVRMWDEEGKQENMATPDLAAYRPMVLRHLEEVRGAP
ncbi:MAG: HD domain-containing protein [Myxococcaceae bacterium]|nr:HD domain-containing protein [Myxococcaceae bacterium]